ncbi:MAG TPA: hypothetical protein VFJ14_17915 [Nocardioidaceae bacterium]|nr:hypothetical protein [Nocardioidaceae bacterium]
MSFATVEQYDSSPALDAALAAWEALSELAIPVPVSWDEDPDVDGFYVASDQAAVRQTLLVYAFTATLTAVRSSSAPLIESRVLAGLRVQTQGGANQAGVTTSTMTPWHAVPDTARGYRAPSGASVVSRIAESGLVRVYLSTGSSGGLADATPSWQQDPASFYDGAATLKVGATDDLPGAEVTTFGYSASAQSYTVPSGVSLLRVVAGGAQGGSTSSGGLQRAGGKGAVVTAEVAVTPGDVLSIMVGGRGGTSGGLYGGVVRGGAPGSSTGGGGGAPSRVTGSAWDIVAGGGGGASVTSQGGAGGQLGQDGYGTQSGSGGGLNAPGSGGPGAGSGSSPSSGIGSGGAGYGAGTGGGGAGYYGGGGGGVSGGIHGSIGAGGGGSSVATSGAGQIESSSYTLGGNAGDGVVTITAIPGSGGVQPPVEIDRWTIEGRQVIASPLGWEISNGLVRVRPSYDGTTATIEVAAFDGGAWRAKTWRLWDKAAGAAVTARARAISVLHNTPEEVRLRWIFDLADDLNTVTVDLRLRRGARLVEITTQSTSSLRWGWLLTTAEAGTSQTWGVYAAANDSGGGRWFITSADAVTADTTTGGLARTAAGSGVTVGIGYVGNYSTAQTADQPQQLAYQFHAAGVETMAVVAQ